MLPKRKHVGIGRNIIVNEHEELKLLREFFRLWTMYRSLEKKLEDQQDELRCAYERRM